MPRGRLFIGVGHPQHRLPWVPCRPELLRRCGGNALRCYQLMEVVRKSYQNVGVNLLLRRLGPGNCAHQETTPDSSTPLQATSPDYARDLNPSEVLAQKKGRSSLI